jgi:hypothetical protein
MKRLLFLLLSMPICAMQNQITPAPSDTSSDEDIVAAALPSDSPAPHPKLIPLMAANLRSSTNPETEVVTKALIEAANDVLNNSVSKKTTGYITAGSTILGAIITALASTYGNTKC